MYTIEVRIEDRQPVIYSGISTKIQTESMVKDILHNGCMSERNGISTYYPAHRIVEIIVVETAHKLFT